MLGNSGKLSFGTMYRMLRVCRGNRFYNVVFGLFQAPYYAFSQTMMAELTPPGFDNMVRCVPLSFSTLSSPSACLLQFEC
jgi:hypothetical protein